MGLIATLLRLTGAKTDTKGRAPGKSVLATGEGLDGQTLTAEVFQSPGILAVPGDGTRGVWVPVGGSSRYGVVIATHNYALNITVDKGETVIFSTNAAGSAVQATVRLKPDGKIEINGNSKEFVTWAALNTALQNHTHGPGTFANGGGPVAGASGAPVGLDLSAAKTNTIKTGG